MLDAEEIIDHLLKSRVNVDGTAGPSCDDSEHLVGLGVLADHVGGQVDTKRLQLLKVSKLFVLKLLLGLYTEITYNTDYRLCIDHHNYF